VGGKFRTERRETVRRTVASVERGVLFVLKTECEVSSRGVLRWTAVAFRSVVRSECVVV
jgi:hypothetical protein